MKADYFYVPAVVYENRPNNKSVVLKEIVGKLEILRKIGSAVKAFICSEVGQIVAVRVRMGADAPDHSDFQR
eukprot:380259-Rhodomonas_salina.1